MKFLLLAIASAFLSLTGNTQKNFEGIITYKLIAPESESDKSDSMKFIVSFGKNAIRIKGEMSYNPTPTVLLIRIDSGLVFNLNQRDSTFMSHALLVAGKAPVLPDNRTIAGYKTRVHKTSTDNFTLGSLFKSDAVAAYISDDLNYAVPDKYRLAPELVMIKDGKIVLGLSVTYPRNSLSGSSGRKNADGELPAQAVFSIEAQEVKWMTLPDSEFEMPLAFRSFDYDATDSVMISYDTTVAADTIAVAPPPENLPASKDVIKSKSSPAKPKSKTSSKTSPARKPD
jgi:hypothetical protein